MNLFPEAVILFQNEEHRAKFLAANKATQNMVVVYLMQASMLNVLATYLAEPVAKVQLMDDSGRYEASDAYLRGVIDQVKKSPGGGFPKAMQVQRALFDKMEDAFINTPGAERGPKIDEVQHWCASMSAVILEWVEKKVGAT